MLKYLSLFSGIGAFESALTNLGVDYEVVNYCEIDKFASKSYSAIHGIPETKNLWDITKVNVFNLPKDVDLITYGFPCQDISLAGHQKGLFNEDGSLTRSGLFFKALDVIEYCKPKVAIAENVKNLVGKKFKPQFDIVLDSLDKAGYNNYWKVLNAKDYGIPQNRERVFIVSIRKDIDNELFEFPKPYSLEKRLKDFLEPQVDEKYYLSDDMTDKLVFKETIGDVKEIGYIKKSENGKKHQSNTVYDSNSISRTLTACDYKSPLMIKEDTKKGYKEATDGDGVYINRPHQKRGCVQNGMIQTIKTSPNDIGVVVKNKKQELCDYLIENNKVKEFDVIKHSYSTSRIKDWETKGVERNNESPTLDTRCDCFGVTVNVPPLRIRKFTPKECYRLMGFSDEEFEKSQNVPTSNAQLYKQAGNSIVVDVLEELFCMMLDEDGEFYL